MTTRVIRWWLLAATVTGLCWGHGRLVDPPSRASAWRFGWNTPIDYNDNEGFCGGYNYQYQMQGGKCGLCGDAWDEDPRPHEVGGKYATGTIVRHYTEGQVIPVTVDITSNHRGHFEFRICPNNNPDVEASQTCLNEHPLFLSDGSGFKYRVALHTGDHLVSLKLPEGLTCTQCVFQWRYVAGNNWGMCENGTGSVGCGPQEEFRACADVAITAQPTWTSNGFTIGANQTDEAERVTSSYSWYSTPSTALTPTLSPTERPPPPPTPIRSTPAPPRTTRRPRPTRPSKPRTTSTTPRLTSTTRRPTPTTRRPTPTTTLTRTTAEGSACRAVGVWMKIPGMDEWCVRNCLHTPPFCPASHCTCD